MIHLKTTCEVAKAFQVKREKQADDSEVVIAHLKIAEVMISRDELDEICAQPIGWSAGALFDDFGAPRAHVTLTLHRAEWSASGVISGGEKSSDPKLRLKDAEIGSLTLDLTKLGALLACQLSWIAAGDEVDDIADMLGKLCAVDLVVTDGGQGDMLKPAAGVLAAVQRLQDGADRHGTTMTISSGAGDEIATIAPKAGRITGFNAVMRKLEEGFHLRGADPDYWIERPDGTERQGVWLNAAKSVLKRGLEPIGDGDTDEVGRWKWRAA
jgi:hypothetical protein